MDLRILGPGVTTANHPFSAVRGRKCGCLKRSGSNGPTSGHPGERYGNAMNTESQWFAEAVIEWVDDRYGRAAAWATAMISAALLIGIPVAIVWYLLT